jgi:hypothetical protein
MWGNTVAIHSVFKEKKPKKTILKKKTQKNEKKRESFRRKNGKKKKHAEKVKPEFSTSSILKKIDKDNFEKTHVGKHCSKTKTMWGNIVTIHNILKKKNYEAKSTKTFLEK